MTEETFASVIAGDEERRETMRRRHKKAIGLGLGFGFVDQKNESDIVEKTHMRKHRGWGGK